MTKTVSHRRLPDHPIAAFFEPCIKIRWRGYGKKLGPYWYADTNKDEPLLMQFLDEAGFKGQRKVSPDQYDKVLEVAGLHGYSIETIGDEIRDTISTIESDTNATH